MELGGVLRGRTEPATGGKEAARGATPRDGHSHSAPRRGRRRLPLSNRTPKALGRKSADTGESRPEVASPAAADAPTAPPRLRATAADLPGAAPEARRRQFRCLACPASSPRLWAPSRAGATSGRERPARRTPGKRPGAGPHAAGSAVPRGAVLAGDNPKGQDSSCRTSGGGACLRRRRGWRRGLPEEWPTWSWRVKDPSLPRRPRAETAGGENAWRKRAPPVLQLYCSASNSPQRAKRCFFLTWGFSAFGSLGQEPSPLHPPFTPHPAVSFYVSTEDI
ncbi:uncharacterized protein [Macaca fascicularis]|uniref:uncharacterized protein n=1 Tax=Macaca fascicularis TaxID=9541 RepID=UPI003D15E094